LIIVLLIITFVFDTFLSLKNYKNRNAIIPKAVEDVYDEEEYKKWLKYNMENFRLAIISSTLNFIIIIALLSFNVFHKILTSAEEFTENIHLQAMIIIGSYFIIDYILGIFFSAYRLFSIETRYGFNKTTIQTFITDKIKALILIIGLGGGLILGLSNLFHNVGKMFYIYALSSTMIIILFLNLFYVKLFVPLFNKLKPLESGELKDKIVEFAKSVGYEVNKISVINASKRSTKLNAFFSGLGKFKHVVLYDTLIDKMTNEQIVSVLAHEIGHAKGHHTLKNLGFMVINLAIFLLILLLCVNSALLSQAFGFKSSNFGFGMLIFFFILLPLNIIIEIISNPISRKFEYEADYFAGKNYAKQSLIEALKILAKENFSNLTPHPLFVAIKYSHPPIDYRIRAINKI
jgi:STE24 endopeptidase